MILTNEQRQSFMAAEGNWCPHCRGDLGSMNEAAGVHEFEDGCLFIVRRCPQCHEQWRETYKLLTVESFPPVLNEPFMVPGA